MLLLASPTWAANYYVATTGSDSNDGSTDNPWLSPQKCVQSGSPLVAGDTCIIRSGTYTNETGSITGGWKGRIMVVNASAPVATSTARITIKSEVPNGAVFQIPNAWPGVDCNSSSCPFAGIYMSGGGSYYTIEGIRFTRPGSSQGTNGSVSGITMLTAMTGVIIRGNEFENIARTVCSNSIFGNAGIFAQESTGILIEKNIFRTIGRLRNGESGCVTDKFAHDHGVYLDVSTDAIVQRNLFYDVTRGYAVNLKARFAGTKTLRATVRNNTFSGDSPTTVPRGQMILVDTHDTTLIQNNIFNEPEDGYVNSWGLSSGTGNVIATGGGITFDHNLTTSTRAETSMTNPSQRPTSGITYTGNLMNTSPGFTDAAGSDFTLTASSAAIDAGTDTGTAKCGAGMDVGVFEVCGPVSGSINTNIGELTIETAFPPVVTFGSTGWMVNCTGSGCGTPTISGLSLKSGSSSVVSITIAGITSTNCAGGQGWTASFNQSTGDLTDSAMIGGRLNQPIHTFSNSSLTNNCGGSAASYPGTPYLLYYLDDNGGTTAADASGNGRDGTLVNGPTWTTGKDGYGVQFVDQGDDYISTGVLSGINPSTTSYTIAFWVNIPAGQESGTRTYAGFSLGTNQRLHIATSGSVWGLGIQSSAFSGTSNLSVTSGWHHVCLQMDSGTDIATLYVDKIAGNSGTQAQKAYTSYTTSSVLVFGRPIGFTSLAPGGVYDDAVVYASLVDCTTLYEVREPSSSGSGGTLTQAAHQWEIPATLLTGGVASYGPMSSTVRAPKGAILALRTQVDRTVSAGSAFATRLWVSHDGGAVQLLTDTPTSDGVSFIGTGADPSIYQGEATCCLTGALTANHGTTQITSGALPTYDAGLNQSYTRRSVIKFTDTASGTYCFFERDQTGVALNGGAVPTEGACVTITEKAAGAP